MSLSIIIAGKRGSGKSTILKHLLSKVNKSAILLYDVNNEHKEFSNAPLKSFDDFVTTVNRVKGAVIAIEEATIFLSGIPSREITELLVKARHRGNTIIFVFHSIGRIPPYIFELSNKIILLKTNDNERKIQEKFGNDDLTTAFLKLKNSPNINRNGKEFSPSISIELE